MKKYIAIDIGGTAIKFGIVDEKDHMIVHDEMPTEAYLGGKGILQKVFDIIEGFLPEGPFEGVAISTAGMVNPEKGEIFHVGPQIPHYAGICFKREVEERYHLVCEVENDVNCAGLAEAISGSAQNASSVLCLTIGTGIGGCFLQNGEVLHGANYSACEVGYMQLGEGSFEELAATSSLIRYVAEKTGQPLENWDGRKIFEGFKQGDVICKQGVERLADYLGKGLANLFYILNPEIIVLGGGIMAQEEILAPLITKSLKSYLVPALAQSVNLVFASHGNHAGMLGACYHFQQKHSL